MCGIPSSITTRTRLSQAYCLEMIVSTISTDPNEYIRVVCAIGTYDIYASGVRTLSIRFNGKTTNLT